MSEDLKPCPHGRKPELFEDITMSGKGKFWVQSPSGWVGPVRTEPDDAIEAWNTRAELEAATVGVKQDARVYVPGAWYCVKCDFELTKSNLNMGDGSITADDKAGDCCPNCQTTLWRISWEQRARQAFKLLDEYEATLSALQPAPEVFATSGAEQRWIEDMENACECCGGSGHKDDMRPVTVQQAADQLASKLWEEYLRVDTWVLQTEEGAHGAKCAIRGIAAKLGVYSEFCERDTDPERALSAKEGE